MNLLKVTEAADFLSVHPNTVRKLIKSGKLPALRLGPKTIRIRIEDLKEMGK
jgi:excisionase family DNA binding protein